MLSDVLGILLSFVAGLGATWVAVRHERKGESAQKSYLGTAIPPLRRPWWEALLAGLIVGFMCWTGWQLQGGSLQTRVLWPTVELWVLWDVSLSMHAVDSYVGQTKVSRLQWTQDFLSKVPEEVPGAHWALVPFAGESALAIEPTEDAEEWRYYLEQPTGLAPEPGSDLEAPLVLVKNAWKKHPPSRDHPVILFLSDGGKEPGIEPSETRLQASVRDLMALKPKMSLISLALGASTPVPIPREGQDPRRGWETNPMTGQPLYTALWLPPLRALAEVSQGKLVVVGSESPSQVWQSVHQALDQAGIPRKVQWVWSKGQEGDPRILLWAVLATMILAILWV
ncbi:VWA domain-containing protein [Candidatus Methylacidithermus pantelleriae]|uniref:VWFA domain-containing protein n=1 Tax=Candidatus Methylacidithermus pantelleriae TaxID=2744239 RepID=A0A8J2FSS4_9BACT|nr:VWA domain-containing protein [Candidatus Methylacidithermus pantelleriae]CAF0698438.1 hypothetical protein MPNT_270017 [Candidatus Methylacidithermus pantelleriae]